MILITEYFVPNNPDRWNEYLFCLDKNRKNPHIDKIYCFLEFDQYIPESIYHDKKLQFVTLGARPTYNYLFNYCSREFPGEICIVSNSDVFFDETLSLITDEYIQGKFLALSRWDFVKDGECSHYDWAYSQDCWIFKSPVYIEGGDYTMGLLGCDNRIAYEAYDSGLDVRNPSKEIKSYHYHNSNYRTYKSKDTLKGDYLFVYSSFIDEDPEIIMCDSLTIGSAVSMVRENRRYGKQD